MRRGTGSKIREIRDAQSSYPESCAQSQPRWGGAPSLIGSHSTALFTRSLSPFLPTHHASIIRVVQPSPAPRAVFHSWVMDTLMKEWALFLDRCLENRIRADLFDAAAAQLYSKSPLQGRKLAALLLRPHSPAASSLDPRVVVYVERLLALRKVDASDVLSSAFQFSKDRPPRAGDVANPKDPSPWQNPPELEEVIFHRLHKAFSGERPERPVTNTEGIRTLIVASGWMSAMVTSHTSDSMMQAMAGIQQHPQQQSINVREALGMLVVGLIENTRILQLLNKDELKGGYISYLPDARSPSCSSSRLRMPPTSM